MKLTSNEINYIKSELENGEYGFANIYKKFSNKTIYISDPKTGQGFIYNEDKALYELLCKATLINDIAESLQSIFRTVHELDSKQDSKQLDTKPSYSISFEPVIKMADTANANDDCNSSVELMKQKLIIEKLQYIDYFKKKSFF